MLSNIASYLLGYAEPTVPSPIEEALGLTTVETEEDDWLIVERPEDVDEKDGVEGEERRRRGSLPCLSLEESWFITPPPCFASTGPVRVETSPLENLLIEHPSMSVYTTTTAGGLGPMVVRRTGGHQTPQEEEEEEGEEEETDPPRTPARARSLSPPPNRPLARPTPTAAPHLHQPRQQLLRLQFKYQNVRMSQELRRSQLDRGNKVREVNNRNRRQSRKDKQKTPSGANNNRKCC